MGPSNLPSVIGVSLLGNVLIYAGLAFINATLVPALLQPVYAITDSVIRSLVMLALCAAPANMLMATAYRMTTPGIASMTILATLVLVLIGKSLLLSARTPGAELAVATVVTIGGAMWVVNALERGA